jgi:hypothetical protein
MEIRIDYAADFVKDAQTNHAKFGHAYARKNNQQFVFSILKSSAWSITLQLTALIHCLLPFWERNNGKLSFCQKECPKSGKMDLKLVDFLVRRLVLKLICIFGIFEKFKARALIA